MKKKVLSLLGLGLIVGLLLLGRQTNSVNDQLTNAEAEVAPSGVDNIATPSTTMPGPTAPASSMNNKVQKDPESELEETKKSYEEALYGLQEAIVRSGKSVDEVVELTEKYGPEEVVNHMPEELRPHFDKIHQIADKITKLELRTDGMPEDFLQKYDVVTPSWIRKTEDEVSRTTLPGSVRKFVESKLKSKSITNQDLAHLVEICEGRERSTCLEKSILTWLQANHQLSSKQHEFIREYL